MKRVYIVKWAKVDGRYTEMKEFRFRANAVTFLNHLILDTPHVDARLSSDSLFTLADCTALLSKGTIVRDVREN